jgi:HAD superfamily phosphoserine phosphatase-like hydrolase
MQTNYPTRFTEQHIQGLVIFDLDGTLLRGPTVCEVLAEPLGYTEEMRELEAISDEEQWTAARVKMAGWYRNYTTAELQGHLNKARWAPGVVEAVDLLRSRKIEIGIASITWSFAVEWFAQRVGIKHFLGTELLEGGEIRHVWGHTKAAWLQETTKSLEIPSGRVAAVGDSRSDSYMLQSADLRFFVGANVPAGLDHVIHMPNCDIRVLAERLLSEWAA